MTASGPSYLRKVNRRQIIESVLRLRRASRAQLSRISGVSSPTVSRIVDDLISNGVLIETDVEQGRLDEGLAGRRTSVGRPSARLELDNRRSRFLAVQIGVRQTRLARVPIALPERDAWDSVFDTPDDAGRWAEQLALHAARLPVADLGAIVVSVPGVFDESTGRVLMSPNLRWLESANLEQLLCRAVTRHANVLMIQEIRALALGHLAASPETGDFLLIDFGTGVGGAAMVGGALYTGPLPLSGEIGHTPVIGNDRRCGCGSVGCVETLVSRRGILASAAEHDGLLTWPRLVEHLGAHGISDWLKRTLDAAAVCISASLNVLGIRRVILTGCMAELPPAVIDYLGDAIRADTMWARFGTIDVAVAPRCRLAGMVHHAICRTLMRSN